MTDPCDALLEELARLQIERDRLENKIEKLETAFNALSDDCVREVVDRAYGSGPDEAADEEERRYVGTSRVREIVAELAPGTQFTIQTVYERSIAHRNGNGRTGGDSHLRVPEFVAKRKASINLALQSLARSKDIEIVKCARGKDDAIWRKPALVGVSGQ